MPYIAKTPIPPYYAVIFTSINAEVDHTEHTEMYGRLAKRAETYDGYLGIEAARNPDGKGVAAVYFKDPESIDAWANDPEHQIAKRKGREIWYSNYMIRVCRVERAYGRPDSEQARNVKKGHGVSFHRPTNP
ncbi:MAG: antibiotic biosynthesis monooxygenase family protein [Burkholderiales bacterium]